MNTTESPLPTAASFGLSQSLAWLGIGSTASSSGFIFGWMCNVQFNHQPTIRASAQAAAKIPRYFPSRNCRRDTGLLITVIAVLPSISSLIEMAAPKTPNSTAASMAVSKQICFIIL